MAQRNVTKEFQNLLKNIDRLTDNQVTLLNWEEDIYYFKVEIRPNDGLYHGGTFVFEVKLPDIFPLQCPEFFCETLIYHPNIDNTETSNNVCISLLEDWDTDCGLDDIIQSLLFLLYNPNLNDPLSPYFDSSSRQVDFEENVLLSLKGKSVDGVDYPWNYIRTDDKNEQDENISIEKDIDNYERKANTKDKVTNKDHDVKDSIQNDRNGFEELRIGINNIFENNIENSYTGDNFNNISLSTLDEIKCENITMKNCDDHVVCDSELHYELQQSKELTLSYSTLHTKLLPQNTEQDTKSNSDTTLHTKLLAENIEQFTNSNTTLHTKLLPENIEQVTKLISDTTLHTKLLPENIEQDSKSDSDTTLHTKLLPENIEQVINSHSDTTLHIKLLPENIEQVTNSNSETTLHTKIIPEHIEMDTKSDSDTTLHTKLLPENSERDTKSSLDTTLHIENIERDTNSGFITTEATTNSINQCTINTRFDEDTPPPGANRTKTCVPITCCNVSRASKYFDHVTNFLLNIFR